MTAIVWLRRDLRLSDHPALRAAMARVGRVVPVFCFDDRLLHGRHRSGSRTQFLLESLAELGEGLRARGSGLVVLRGEPERELPALAASIDAAEVHASGDAGPFARGRDARVGRALGAVGARLVLHPGVTVLDDAGAPLTRSGAPSTVFTPFHRAWLRAPRRERLAMPRELPPLPPGVAAGELPTLGELGLAQELRDPMRGGESAGLARLERFLAGPVRVYGGGQDELGGDRSSRLSPYLHFGCVSARAVEASLPAGEGPAAFRRQLCWRDFYAHVLIHFPRNAHAEMQERYRGSIAWSDDAGGAFDAWAEGRTGFPLVDAGMRQLAHEGWMPGRARLVVGSFLTKDLGIDWRRGERWFMRLLIDGDEANNNGNWQWIASVGTDPQPAFRRIYNPARQMERHDPRGTYVRRWLPELRSVPDAYLAEPWTMPAQAQRAAGCEIGRDYPRPIVDHRRARERALERYRT